MKLLYLIFSLMLTSCANRHETYTYYEHPEFTPYLRKFEKEFNIKIAVPSDFGSLKEDNVGTCYYSGIPNSKANLIRIDLDTWRTYNEGGREQLLYHELGHCVLGLDHDDTVGYIDGIRIPVSIMNSYVFGNHWIYSTYRNYYVEELKGKL